MKANLKYIYLVFILTITGGLLIAQNISQTSLTDSTGLKTGRWTTYTYLTNQLIPTTDSLDAPFYRVANFINGKPSGFVNYYYKSGRLYFQTKVSSLDPDIYTDGKIKFYSEKGEPITELFYLNGMLNGEAFYYFDDGKPMMQGYYTDNVRSGIWKKWEQDGMYGIGAFNDDVADGKWVFYYADGSLRSEGNMRNGMKHGKWSEYYPDGHTETGPYINSVREGVWSCSDSNGKACHTGTYVAGKKNGSWKEWSADGLLHQGCYLDDAKTGIWTISDATGKILTEGSYLYGKKDGEWKQYDDTGNIINLKLYKEDEIVTP